MSDAITIASGPGETWRPTGELRWYPRRQHIKRFSIPAGGGSVELNPMTPTLQQRWASDVGTYEWRDVPTVEG